MTLLSTCSRTNLLARVQESSTFQVLSAKRSGFDEFGRLPQRCISLPKLEVFLQRLALELFCLS
jgi:hypothetical protein